MNTKKIVSITSALIILIVLIIYFFASAKDKNNLATVAVTQGDIAEKVTAVGTIAPQQTTSVKSQISGRVAKLLHDDGDYVKQGEPLLEVDPNPTPQDYIVAKQTVAIDLAKEQQYAADVKRYKQLIKDKTLSPNAQEYNDAVSNYQQNHQQRLIDEEKLALMEKSKITVGNRTIANVITSPTDGYIVQRNVNLGDPVIPQTNYQAGNLLFVIADMHALIFKGQVSETDVAKLQVNTPATIKVAALPDRKLQGVLTKIALQSEAAATPDASTVVQNANPNGSDSNSTSPFAVGYKVEVHNLTPLININLRSGYSATADIIVKQAKNVLLIPARVLQFENDKPYVMVTDKKGKQQKRFIKTGLSDGVQVQVLSGLNKGEKIVEMTTPIDDDNG